MERTDTRWNERKARSHQPVRSGSFSHLSVTDPSLVLNILDIDRHVKRRRTTDTQWIRLQTTRSLRESERHPTLVN